jgi:RNase H-fold protein (predicted Holliday junction resolvase)
LSQVNASTLVIGSPRPSAMHRAFGSGDVMDFAEALQQNTGIEVIVVT